MRLSAPARTWAILAVQSAIISDLKVSKSVVSVLKEKATEGAPRALFRLVIEKNKEGTELADLCRDLAQSTQDEQANVTDIHTSSLIVFLYDGPKGKLWQKWNAFMTKTILALKSKSTSDTALKALTLEVYYIYTTCFGGGK